jgi:hypothetical protein|nr:hypothetical protein [Kofleriaceae bacterium]
MSDLDDLSERLAAIDVDPARAAKIAADGRADLARGPRKRRYVEPIVVALLVASFLAWALWHTFG